MPSMALPLWDILSRYAPGSVDVLLLIHSLFAHRLDAACSRR